jgi:argininosuccinate lyase
MSASDSKQSSGAKLWGGRFSGETDPLFERFNESIHFDRRFWSADLRGSQAYAKALAKAGVITDEEASALVDGLDKVAAEWRDDKFDIQSSDEDIHTANERRLGEIVGAVAGKLHTGRSRNDQVATDFRLWMMDEISALLQFLSELIQVALRKASEDMDVIMAGYTHLQPAQPVRWSHWIMR